MSLPASVEFTISEFNLAGRDKPCPYTIFDDRFFASRCERAMIVQDGLIPEALGKRLESATYRFPAPNTLPHSSHTPRLASLPIGFPPLV